MPDVTMTFESMCLAASMYLAAKAPGVSPQS